jgi:hypothetical protein
LAHQRPERALAVDNYNPVQCVGAPGYM